MTKLFLDTNILARFLLGDLIEQHSEVLDIFKKAKSGQIKLYTIPEVFIELNYVLSKIYSIEKLSIVDGFKKVIQFSFIECQNLDIFSESLEIYKDGNISLEDAYFIKYCLTNNLTFYTFDQKALKLLKNLSQ